MPHLSYVWTRLGMFNVSTNPTPTPTPNANPTDISFELCMLSSSSDNDSRFRSANSKCSAEGNAFFVDLAAKFACRTNERGSLGKCREPCVRDTPWLLVGTTYKVSITFIVKQQYAIHCKYVLTTKHLTTKLTKWKNHDQRHKYHHVTKSSLVEDD